MLVLQLQALLNWGQTFAFHILNKENRLRPASPYTRCIHGRRQDRCSALANSTTNVCAAHQRSPQVESKTDKKVKPTSSDDKVRKTSSLHPKLSLGGKGKGPVTPETKEEDKEDAKTICLTEDDLKYRMTRVSVEDINLFIVESGVACNIQVRRSDDTCFMLYEGIVKVHEKQKMLSDENGLPLITIIAFRS